MPDIMLTIPESIEHAKAMGVKLTRYMITKWIQEEEVNHLQTRRIYINRESLEKKIRGEQ